MGIRKLSWGQWARGRVSRWEGGKTTAEWDETVNFCSRVVFLSLLFVLLEESHASFITITFITHQ